MYFIPGKLDHSFLFSVETPGTERRQVLTPHAWRCMSGSAKPVLGAEGGKPVSSSGSVDGSPAAQTDQETPHCRGKRQPGWSTERRRPVTRHNSAQGPPSHAATGNPAKGTSIPLLENERHPTAQPAPTQHPAIPHPTSVWPFATWLQKGHTGLFGHTSLGELDILTLVITHSAIPLSPCVHRTCRSETLDPFSNNSPFSPLPPGSSDFQSTWTDYFRYSI
jgi:hypothetical protein